MQKNNAFTKILAIAGTVLIWIPILAPILFGVISLITEGQFRFDFLMPAEIFPVALVGAGLLLWAGIRARSHWKLIAWGIGVTIGLLVGSQALAVVTGLANGDIESQGIWFILVMALFVLFLVALIVTAVAGILLLRDLFKKQQEIVEK
jgi:hypothetical protein